MCGFPHFVRILYTGSVVNFYKILVLLFCCITTFLELILQNTGNTLAFPDLIIIIISNNNIPSGVASISNSKGVFDINS